MGLFLSIATVIAYQPAWRAGFIWDDDVYVTTNPLLTAPDGFGRIWFSMDSPSQYFPLTYTVFRLEHGLWGLNPAGYHWVNILLHAANALLVWQLLKRLGVPGAWLAAAIFALHPVEVESVAWVTELKSVLSLFFILLALLAWIEFIGEQSKRFWYWLALIFFAFALFSKTTACTLPAALLLILWLKKKRIDWRRLTQVVPFLAMGVGMGLLTIWWERFHQGTQGKLFSMGLTERILVASRAVWFYAGKLFWPVNLTFSYPKWTINPADPLAYGWLAAGVGFCAAIYFARRLAGRSVEVAVLFFVATLIPLLGFIMLYTFRYTFVADHYQYVASIGLIALAAAGMTIVLSKWEKTKPLLKPAVCGMLLLTLGTMTWRQCRMYADEETLWQTTIQKNPDSWAAFANLGDHSIKNGKLDEAIVCYQKLLEFQPGDASTYVSIGAAFLQKGQTDKAASYFERTLEANPNPADYAEACNNLGYIFAIKGRLDQAIVCYYKAIESKPDIVSTYLNLGLALAREEKWDKAIESYHEALQLDPNHASVYTHLATALEHQGRQHEAIQEYQEALRLNPNDSEALRQLHALEQ